MRRLTPVDEAVELRLSDGSRATMRSVEPGDKKLLADAFAELGDESRHRRFFTSLRELDARQLAYLTEVDHHDHEALVAIDIDSRACVGVARFVRTGEAVAEPALAVVDDWQRRGLGTALLEHLAVRARSEGITRFSAAVLADNRDAIRLIERLGGATHEQSGGELRFDVALAPPGGAPTLRELLRAAAAGFLAPARAFMHGQSRKDA